MADYGTELEFVGAFAALAAQKHENALRTAAALPPEVLEDGPLRGAFRVLSERHAAGRECGLENAECAGAVSAAMAAPSAFVALTDVVMLREDHRIGAYARTVLESYRARRQADLLADAAVEARRLAASAPDRARGYGEFVAEKLVSIQQEVAEDGEAETLDEIVDQEIALMEAGGVKGIPWPFEKFTTAALGPILPGDCIGMTAHPNGGKTLTLANFLRFWLEQGVPCLTFVPEKPLQFYRRMWAVMARVPQANAERLQWADADEPTRHRFGCAVERSRGFPWVPVRGKVFTVEDIIARARILRRQFPGQHVMLVVDHMYDLSYPNGDTDRLVADAVRRIRKFTEDDRDGGMSSLLLMQPVKIKELMDRYKAVRADQIRGQVAQVLDFHFSPFRRFVKTDQRHRTAWDTPCCYYDERGWPEAAEVDDPMGKDDDEHMYFKMDRRKTGGPFSPTIVLPIEGPTGFISDLAAKPIIDPWRLP